MQTSCSFIPPHPLHLSPPLLHPSSPPRGLLCRLSRRSDTSACTHWYSATRFSWWPRSGTNSLFNPLIIIKVINKFGWKTTPWTQSLYPQQKFIFLSFFFSHCCLVTKGVASSGSFWSKVWNRSIKWMRWTLPLCIFKIKDFYTNTECFVPLWLVKQNIWFKS